MIETTYYIPNMESERIADKIVEGIYQLEGVTAIRTDITAKKVVVTCHDSDAWGIIEPTLEQLNLPSEGNISVRI